MLYCGRKFSRSCDDTRNQKADGPSFNVSREDPMLSEILHYLNPKLQNIQTLALPKFEPLKPPRAYKPQNPMQCLGNPYISLQPLRRDAISFSRTLGPRLPLDFFEVGGRRCFAPHPPRIWGVQRNFGV